MAGRRVYLNPLSASTPLARALSPFFPRYRSLAALDGYPEHLRGALRTLVMSTDRKLLFLRNHRCASTAIAQLLHYYGEGRFHDGSIHRARRGVVLARYAWDEVEPVFNDRSAVLFTVTRDPVARAWSAFRALCMERTVRAVQNHLGPMRDHGYDARRGLAYNFDVFMDYVETTLHIDPLQTSAHFRPQVYNLAYGEIPYDYIGKVERLAHDLRNVFDRVGAPDFPPEAVIARGLRSKADEAPPLSPVQRRRLRQIFEKDFEAFGYDI